MEINSLNFRHFMLQGPYFYFMEFHHSCQPTWSQRGVHWHFVLQKMPFSRISHGMQVASKEPFCNLSAAEAAESQVLCN